jgi:hypothetical protein
MKQVSNNDLQVSSHGQWRNYTMMQKYPKLVQMNIVLSGTETLPYNVKRERAFTLIIKYPTLACNSRFSKTQFRL